MANIATNGYTMHLTNLGNMELENVLGDTSSGHITLSAHVDLAYNGREEEKYILRKLHITARLTVLVDGEDIQLSATLQTQHNVTGPKAAKDIADGEELSTITGLVGMMKHPIAHLMTSLYDVPKFMPLRFAISGKPTHHVNSSGLWHHVMEVRNHLGNYPEFVLKSLRLPLSLQEVYEKVAQIEAMAEEKQADYQKVKELFAPSTLKKRRTHRALSVL